MVVYIKTQGARIVKEGRHLLVKKGEDTYHTLFTYKLNQIVIYGNVEITHRSLVQILRNEIDLVFLTQNGRYLGRLATPEAKNIFLRKRQFNLLDDSAFGLRMARAIVAGKLSNMSTLLMRIKRSRDKSCVAENAHAIQRLLSLLEKAETVESVRGYEGRGTALFFAAFPEGFIEDMGFKHRVRRPPTDPVNAVLSLLYTFLMNRVYAAVRIAGLDPYPGFLHAIDYGRYSLVLDLMEEFRTIIVDTLVLSLFNLKILKKDDFFAVCRDDTDEADRIPELAVDVTRDPIGWISGQESERELQDLPDQRMMESDVPETRTVAKYPVRLQSGAFQRVIEAFEKKLTTVFYYPPAERRLTYADAIIYQAGLYRKVVEGEATVYLPILLK